MIGRLFCLSVLLSSLLYDSEFTEFIKWACIMIYFCCCFLPTKGVVGMVYRARYVSFAAMLK